MAVAVSFYSYQGKPNVAVKDFSGQTPVVKNLNFVTSSKPELRFSIECNEKLDKNYCTWEVDGSTQYWFIDSRESNKGIWIYYLELDVLATMWDAIKNKTQMVERTTTRNGCNMSDSLWKTGNGFDIDVVDITNPEGGNPFLTTTSLANAHPIFFCLSGLANSGAGTWLDPVTTPGTCGGYILNSSESRNVQDSFYNNTLLQLLLGWYYSNPADCLVSYRLYPFDLKSRINPLQAISSEPVNVTCGNNFYMVYAGDGGVFDQPVTAHFTSSSQATFSIGHINCTRQFNDFRDFPPYTTCYIWLPYIGVQEIDPTPYYETGKIYITYRVDLINGNTIVRLAPNNWERPMPANNGFCQYVNATIGADVPFGTSNTAEVLRGLLMNAAMLAGTGVSNASAFEALMTPSYDTSRPLRVYDPNNVLSNQANYITHIGNDSLMSWTDDMLAENDANEAKLASREGEVSAAMRQMRIAAYTGMHCLSRSPRSSVHAGSGGLTNYRTMSRVAHMVRYKTKAVCTDKSQYDLYGKLYMQPAKLNDLTGFIKLATCNLPMLGMRVDVYNRLVDILVNGFYKTNTWSDV